MLISLAYRLTRKVLGALATVARRDISKDAELLVLRHENALLRRHIPRVRYEPEDRLWLSALTNATSARYYWTTSRTTTPPTPINLANYRLRRKAILSGLTSEYHIAA
jgi:putative transposase